MLTTSDRGLFVWHELNTTDVEAADRFYSKLIGWKTTAWEPNPSYKIWTMGREGRGGLYLIHEEPNAVTPPPHWLTYIGTPDVDATVRQAVELGGKVVTPAYDVHSIGRMAVLQDPQGAMFAVSAQFERSEYKNPQLGDFSWHELLTTNPQTAWDFYHKLFGWMKTGATDMGEGRMYQMFGHGGIPVGGIFHPPTGLPGRALWIPYVMVRDARRSADVAKELGANVVHGPMEVPGGDWIFTGVDHQGAFFATHSKKRATTTTKNTKTTTKNTKNTKTTTKNTKSTKTTTKNTKSTKKSTKKGTKKQSVRTTKARRVRSRNNKKPSRRR
ncbi:MAG TPA: VOC family protein [Vicinamibacterales bacterium]|nr:VOC family protein [Vicinamibacterales bacterium]